MCLLKACSFTSVQDRGLWLAVSARRNVWSYAMTDGKAYMLAKSVIWDWYVSNDAVAWGKNWDMICKKAVHAVKGQVQAVKGQN